MTFFKIDFKMVKYASGIISDEINYNDTSDVVLSVYLNLALFFKRSLGMGSGDHYCHYSTCCQEITEIRL